MGKISIFGLGCIWSRCGHESGINEEWHVRNMTNSLLSLGRLATPDTEDIRMDECLSQKICPICSSLTILDVKGKAKQK